MKFKANGSLDKHKAKLVAKGYAQHSADDFNESFSPTPPMMTIWTILTLVAHHRWPFFQMYVKSAFLNGELHQVVYVDQPPRF